MAFWGVSLRPDKTYTLKCDLAAPKRLRISQARLENRSCVWNTRSIVQCKAGSNEVLSLCSLSPKEVHSCQLDLEFDETEDVVFSVKGPRGVDLVGYFHDNVDNDGVNTARHVDDITEGNHGVEVQNNTTKEIQEKGRALRTDDVADDQQNKEISNEENSSLHHQNLASINKRVDTPIRSKKVQKKKRIIGEHTEDLKKGEYQNSSIDREKQNAVNGNKQAESDKKRKDGKRRREHSDDDGISNGITIMEDEGDKICQDAREKKSKDGNEDLNFEQVGSYLSSISHKKKKKKSRTGEATMESQSDLHNGRIHVKDVCRSDNNASKDEKKKNKHANKKREAGKNEDGTSTPEGITSSKVKQKSSSITKGDLNHATSSLSAANEKAEHNNDKIEATMELQPKEEDGMSKGMMETKRSKRLKTSK